MTKKFEKDNKPRGTILPTLSSFHLEAERTSKGLSLCLCGIIGISDFTDSEIFIQEVALYKLSTPCLLENKQISKIIRHNNARVIEVNSTYTVVEKTGKTDAVMSLYKEFVAEQCVLQFVKSGRVAITRDVNVNLSDHLFDEDAKRKTIK